MPNGHPSRLVRVPDENVRQITMGKKNGNRTVRPLEDRLEQNGIIAGSFDFSGNVQKVINVVVADSSREATGRVTSSLREVA